MGVLMAEQILNTPYIPTVSQAPQILATFVALMVAEIRTFIVSGVHDQGL
jgi:hypothetical protein